MVSLPGPNYRRGSSAPPYMLFCLVALVIILGIYSWSLSKENRSLKTTVLQSYARVRQVTDIKNKLERRNTVLSNRMVEMEEQRDSAKEGKEDETKSRESCEKKLNTHGEKMEEANLKFKKIMDEVYPENNKKNPDEEELVTDQSKIDVHVIIEKIKDLKTSIASLKQDYGLLQNKFTNLDKDNTELEHQRNHCEKKLKEMQGQQKPTDTMKKKQETTNATPDETAGHEESTEQAFISTINILASRDHTTKGPSGNRERYNGRNKNAVKIGKKKPVLKKAAKRKQRRDDKGKIISANVSTKPATLVDIATTLSIPEGITDTSITEAPSSKGENTNKNGNSLATDTKVLSDGPQRSEILAAVETKQKGIHSDSVEHSEVELDLNEPDHAHPLETNEQDNDVGGTNSDKNAGEAE